MTFLTIKLIIPSLYFSLFIGYLQKISEIKLKIMIQY